MSNEGKKRNEHLWRVGSKLVENTKKHYDFYWVITDSNEESVSLDAYHTDSDRYYGAVGTFRISGLENLSLGEIKVKATRLAKKMYPNAKQEGDYLLIPEA